MKVKVEKGKYTVIQEKDGRLRALRYGEEWRDLVGDNLVFSLAAELQETRELVKHLIQNIGTISPYGEETYLPAFDKTVGLLLREYEDLS